MAASEKRVQLQIGIIAIVSTQDDMDCVELCTTPDEQEVRGFNTKGFLLKYGLEEHKGFHLLLKQLEATISLGIDRQTYCMKTGQTDDFLKTVDLLIADYFSYACTRGDASF